MQATLQRSALFVRRRLFLFSAGIACEVLYLFFFLQRFPLLKYYKTLTDIGYMQEHSQESFLAFVLVMTILFALFGLACWESCRYFDSGTFWLILGFGAVFALTMVFVYPGTAIDVFTYITQSLILVEHHANPMVIPGTAFPGDPLLQMSGGLIGTPSPYGPLAIYIDAFSTIIAGTNYLINLLLLKFFFADFLLLEAFLVGKILSYYSPKIKLAGVLFICWNPYSLYEYCANAHNDIVLMLFVTLAVWALVKERLYLAIALVTASVLVKYATIVLLPLFLIYGIWHQPGWSRRLGFACIAVGGILLMSILAYWPFWSGTTTIRSTLNEDNVYMASFATLLQTLAAGRFPLSQGKLIGRVIYSGIYLYSVYLATKGSKGLLQGAFLALFFLIALATSKFEIWYALWPVVLAILTGRRSLFLTAFLLTYGASLSVTLYVYIWFWMGINDQTVQIIHSTAYALTFVPALLLLMGMALRKQLRLVEESILSFS